MIEDKQQIDIIEADIKAGMRIMEAVNPRVYRGLSYRTAAKHLESIGYRKQSEDMVSISTVKKWLYEIAINNVGCVLNGDFSTACEEIISRLDGLKRFAEEMKGGA